MTKLFNEYSRLAAGATSKCQSLRPISCPDGKPCLVAHYEDDMRPLFEGLLAGRLAVVEVALVERLAAALNAKMIMESRGPKPAKLDAALTWRANDELAKSMAQEALAAARAAGFGGGVK